MTLPLAHRDVPDSPLARWDSRWKLAALVLAAFGIAALDRLAPSLVALAIGLVLVTLARLPEKWVRGRLGLFALAALPFLIVLPFTLDISGPVGMSLARSASPNAARSQVRRLRAVWRSVASLSYSWGPPLHHASGGAHKLGRACSCSSRASHIATPSCSWTNTSASASRTRAASAWRRLGTATNARPRDRRMLVRGAERADRVSEAMRCRGFDGTFHTTAAFRTTAADVLAFAVLVSVTVAIVLWDPEGLS